MRFVIVGAGRVGLRTARALTKSGHDVTLVEVNPDAADRARAEGFDVIEGDGSIEDTMEQVDLETADAVGGLTGDLNDNFAVCLIANQHGCRTVMRVDEDYREDIYREYADQVDEVIYPERLGAILAKNALLGGNIRAIADIARNLQMVELTITEASPMRGYSISELELPGDSRLLAFGKQDGPVRIPTEDDTLDLGDRLIVLAAFDKLDDVRSLIVGDSEQALTGGI